jgi:hypothetical protein
MKGGPDACTDREARHVQKVSKLLLGIAKGKSRTEVGRSISFNPQLTDPAGIWQAGRPRQQGKFKMPCPGKAVL